MGVPMVNMTWSHDVASGVCDLAVIGPLDAAAVRQLRQAVLRILAEQPLTILLDLNAMEVANAMEAANALEVADSAALDAVPALDQRAFDDCGIHLRCYVSPDNPRRAQIAAAVADLPLYDNRPQAQEAGLEQAAGVHRFHLHFPVDQTLQPAARSITEGVCVTWGVGQLAAEAGLIVSELTNNVVQHTDGEFDLVLLLRGALLHIQVIDSDRRVPVFPIIGMGPRFALDAGEPEGFGLYLVRAIATDCGVAVRPRGKIVWATLRP